MNSSLGLRVDHGKVIWVTREWVTPQVAKSSLFLRDLSTGTTQLLATATGQFEDLEATLSGNLLASLNSSDGEDFDLTVRNLSTGSSRSLAEFHAQPLSYSVGDGMVAWQDSKELPAGQGYLGKILVYDDTTGKVTQLAESVGLGRPMWTAVACCSSRRSIRRRRRCGWRRLTILSPTTIIWTSNRATRTAKLSSTSRAKATSVAIETGTFPDYPPHRPATSRSARQDPGECPGAAC